MINFKCPHCNAIIETDDIYAGQNEICPQCGKEITVPMAKAVQSTPVNKHRKIIEPLKNFEIPELFKRQLSLTTMVQLGCFLVLLFIAIVFFVKATERTSYTYSSKTVSIEYSDSPGVFNSFSGLALALEEELRHYEIVSATPIVDTYQKNYGNSEYVTGLRPITQTTKVVFILRKKTTFRFYHLGYWRTGR